MGDARAEDEFIDMPSGKPNDNLKTFSCSFSSWCFSIIRWTLASRTDFGRYLASLLCIRRDGPPSSPTALFPLPLPDFEPVANVDFHMPKGERLRRMLNRPLLVVLLSSLPSTVPILFPRHLSYWADEEAAQYVLQQQAIDRLRLLVKACDPGRPIEVASSGRKNLVPVAKLQELLAAAMHWGSVQTPTTMRALASTCLWTILGIPSCSPTAVSMLQCWPAEDHWKRGLRLECPATPRWRAHHGFQRAHGLREWQGHCRPRSSRYWAWKSWRGQKALCGNGTSLGFSSFTLAALSLQVVKERSRSSTRQRTKRWTGR